ncbi:MAG: Gfo/Idh/MocA family protein [Clostridiaceae bacterium]
MKMGILGDGYIARNMLERITEMEGFTNYAVASKDYKMAKSFAKEFEFVKVYDSYEEMLLNPEVDIVCVATPSSHHYEHIKLCLIHGKHVFCIQAFTINVKQAEEIFDLAVKNKLLLL